MSLPDRSTPLRVSVELDGGRRDLRTWIAGHSPSLGELYEGILWALRDRPPGYVRFVAHGVREIGNTLPAEISGVKRPGTLNYKGRLDQIRTIWIKHGALESDLAESAAQAPSPSLTLPSEAIRPVADLLREHHAVRERPIDSARRLFLSAAPENAEFAETLQPILRQWLDVMDWFMGHAHDNGRCDHECSHDELLRQFELFERALMAIARGFYTTVDELDDILEDANS